MDDARALLDSLMGPSRDKNTKDQPQGEGWKDKNVCKRYIIGFCPNNAQDNWFHNTRRDTGRCNKIHSDKLKEEFLAHKDKDKYLPEYEADFLRYLEGLVREADAWIMRERKNCTEPGIVTRLPPGMKQRLDEMQERSEALMKKAEELNEAGDFTAGKQAVEMAGQLKEEVKEQTEKYTFMSGGETVCEICGVRCNPDEAADYQAHMNGKLHESYSLIRSKVKELRENERKRGEKDRSGGAEGVEKKGDDRGRDRGRDRGDNGDRERDRRPANDRSRSKDRRDRPRDGDRDRRDRDRDRDDRRDDRRDRDVRDRDGGGGSGGGRPDVRDRDYDRRRSRSRRR
eukprot:gnl/TRDRNA2_/TRDRNA2_162159_c2_seq1.p1 gnl/TRDRNA2_/TRDRNA2_162159_c2~~gnl/TRDRNA2_/TRDRNA2_162159_c2_seq1.p1  ORF type:complete len:342 (+),score=71.51 gnl/TRDRNA2_/TRDRNA2_162159_c2_seq1:119-1144(+)